MYIATFGVEIKPVRQKYQSDINALNVHVTGQERLEYNVKRNYSTKKYYWSVCCLFLLWWLLLKSFHFFFILPTIFLALTSYFFFLYIHNFCIGLSFWRRMLCAKRLIVLVFKMVVHICTYFVNNVKYYINYVQNAKCIVKVCL